MRSFAWLLLLGAPSLVLAASPNCDSPNGWAANMAFVHLKNAGLVSSNNIDFSKTKVVRLVSEKLGKDLYRQVHKVTFTDKSGNTIEVITINDASHVECSMSGIQVFVVSKELGKLDE